MTQHQKENKDYAKQASINIEPLIDMYNWNGIKHPTVTPNNNYALFERKNLKVALIMLHVSVDIKPFIEEGEVKARVYIYIYINQTIVSV